MNHQFVLPGSYKKWTYGLIGAGIIALVYGFIAFHPFNHPVGEKDVDSTRFWAVLLQKQCVLATRGKCFNVLHVRNDDGNGCMAGSFS